jgi:hypothetical protein
MATPPADDAQRRTIRPRDPLTYDQTTHGLVLEHLGRSRQADLVLVVFFCQQHSIMIVFKNIV